jgi:peptide/nickel transport system permease protein
MPPTTALPSSAGEGLEAATWRNRLQASLVGIGPASASAPDASVAANDAALRATTVDTVDAESLPAIALHVSPWRSRWPTLHALVRLPSAIVGLVLLSVVAGIAVFAGVLFPGDPLDIVGQPLLRPWEDPAFLLGTDQLGRDIAAGLAHGARVSLLVGLTAAGVGVTVGTLIGATAGYFGGKVDAVLTWLIEIFQTTPSFLLVIVIVSITQSSLEVIAVVIGLTTWETVARLIRAQFRALLSSDFVLAARSLGYGHCRIILREILPNALPPVVVTASVMVAGAILMESSLAFLGVGDANKVSWGSMIGDGRDMLRTAPHLTVIPGLALIVTVFSLNLLGDALIEAMNPRLRRRSA